MKVTHPVYVADDDMDDLLFVKNSFEKFNEIINLKTFSNGRDLINDLVKAETPPVFILLDLNMPIMTGLDALKLIRKNKALAHLKVIVFSTSTSPKERDTCLLAGANDYICKPYTLDEYEKIATQLFISWVFPVLQKTTVS